MPETDTDALVYIIEDDEAMGAALITLFSSVQLKTHYCSGGAAFLAAIDKHPTTKGCILMDIRLPDISGLDLQKLLKKRNNQLPIIFITAHGDINMAVNATKAGAFDFITKPFSNQALLEQVQRAILLTSSQVEFRQFKENLNKLTGREKQVLQYIVEGKISKEIGVILNISLSTVELHRSNIMKKLIVRNIAELIKYYLISEGLARSPFCQTHCH